MVMGLGLTLVMCSEDDAKQVNSAGGEGGEAAAGEGPVSGGSAAQPSAGSGSVDEAGSGGMSEVEAGGAAGSPTSSGAGGMAAAGEAGAAGAPSCEPTSCCSAEEELCTAGWDANCATSESCCDPLLGIRRQCGYGGGGIDYSADVCVNDCTSQSYGSQSCAECLNQADPSCDGDWAESCSTDSKVYCSDEVAGYRKSCIDVDQYSRTFDVECVCDPDL
jgi:hypothetical protein